MSVCQTIQVTGVLSYEGVPVVFPELPLGGTNEGKPFWSAPVPGGSADVVWSADQWNVIFVDAGWFSTEDVATPELVQTWEPVEGSAGTPIVKCVVEPCCENPLAVLESQVELDILEAAREGILTERNAHVMGIDPFTFLLVLLLAEVDEGDGTWDGCGACGLKDAVYGNPKDAILGGALTAANSHILGISRGQFFALKAIAETL